MADRIIVMNKAVVMQSGTPQQIYDSPGSSFVADFIGSINFLDTSLPVWDSLGFPKGKIIAIRPEKVKISRERGTGSVHGTIEDIELRDQNFQEGEGVYLSIPRDETLQFESETTNMAERKKK